MSKTKPAGGRENLGRALTLHPAGGLLVGQAHSVGPKGVTRPGLAIETLTVELWARRPRALGEMPRYGELVLPTAAAGPLTPFPADSMDPAGPAVRTGADRSPHPCQSTGCPLIPIPRKLHEPHHSTIDTCPPTTGAPTLPPPRHHQSTDRGGL